MVFWDILKTDVILSPFFSFIYENKMYNNVEKDRISITNYGAINKVQPHLRVVLPHQRVILQNTLFFWGGGPTTCTDSFTRLFITMVPQTLSVDFGELLY